MFKEQTSHTTSATIYYDGACGLCAKEIAFYQKIAPHSGINWCDITKNSQTLEAHGISLSTALKHLHAQDQDGVFHIEIDAFILIWKHLPQRTWHILAWLIKLPGIYTVAKAAYSIFAKRRFNTSSHRQIALKHDEPADNNTTS